MKVLYFLMYVFTVNVKGEQEPETNRESILEKILRTGTVIVPDYQLVTRQLATDIYTYENYKSVSVVFYPITEEVTEARFTFQSMELHLNNFGSCRPNEVIIHLKYGAYPAVNPDGYKFPKDFIEWSMRDRIHTLELISDGKNISYTIENPKPGIWYSLTYIKWEDPRKEKIVQQGFDAECQTILYSDLQVKLEEDIIQIDCYAGTTIEYDMLPVLFKCLSLTSGETITLNVKTSELGKLYIGVDATSIPTEDNNILYCSLDAKDSIQVITFIPHPAVWHYIQVGNIEGNVSMIPICKSSFVRSDLDELTNYTIIDLVRIEKGRFFAFDYSLPSNSPNDKISLVNITSSEIKSLRFQINQFVDIGGSLLISASILMNLRYYMEYRRGFEKQSLFDFNYGDQHVKAVICIDIGHPSIPLHSGHCKYNDKLKPALFVLNSIDSDSSYDKTYIPFPESGAWYLTLRIFCESADPCKAVENGSMYYVDGSLDKGEGSNVHTSEDNITISQGTSECTIVLVVSSMSCVNSTCSDHGDCRLHAFGGLVMSFCSCRDGFGGWDCSDGTRMDRKTCMLVSVLFLTLSNLLFILSIYVAIIRLYHTEAVMYTFTMFFSTFYHACDAPNQVAFCMFRRRILQYGDFYCAIISFWLTLLAMCILGDKLRSFLQLIGAFFIAILLVWNMFSFISFTFPAVVGVVILIISWYLDFRKNQIFKYTTTYYIVYLPLGLILILFGFICFAFLQTKQNYQVIHSIWHMIVALGIVLLLPDVRRGTEVNAFLPSSMNCKINICKYFRKSQPPATPAQT